MILTKLKSLLILVLIVIFSLTVKSQDTIFSTQKNSLNIGIENRFLKTISFGVQKMITEKGFITVNAAVQAKSPYEYYEQKQIGLLYIENWNKNRVFTSKSISAGYGQFLIPKVGFYVALEVRYQYRYFENKYYYECRGTSSDSKASLRSEYHHNIGIMPVAGYRLVIIKGGKLSFISDFNFGLMLGMSIQENYIHGEAQGTCSPNNPYWQYYPEAQTDNINAPDIASVFRIKIGIIF